MTPYYPEVVHNGRLKLSGVNCTRLLQRNTSHNIVDSCPTPETTSPALVADERLYHDSDGDHDAEDSEHIQPSRNAGLRTPSSHTEEIKNDVYTAVGAATSANSVSSFELRRLLKEAEDIVHEVHERKSTRSRTAAASTALSSNPSHFVSGPSASSQQCAMSYTKNGVEPTSPSHLWTYVLCLSECPTDSTATSKRTDEERKQSFKA